MSFTFDTLDTESFGVTATLQRLPTFAGLQLETLEAPGTDGVILGGTTRASAQFVFDTIIHGASVAHAQAVRDAIALILDPARGEQWLTFDAVPGWRWRAIVSTPIEWERLTWDAGLGFQLRADVTFDALSAYGRQVDEEVWEYSGPGSHNVYAPGNSRSFPTVELAGSLTAAQTVTVGIGDVTVTVSGPLNEGELMRLDWDTFEFARWNTDGPSDSGGKVASVVRQMSTLDRPEMWPSNSTRVSVSTTGTVDLVRVRPNARRQ